MKADVAGLILRALRSNKEVHLVPAADRDGFHVQPNANQELLGPYYDNTEEGLTDALVDLTRRQPSRGEITEIKARALAKLSPQADAVTREEAIIQETLRFAEAASLR